MRKSTIWLSLAVLILFSTSCATAAFAVEEGFISQDLLYFADHLGNRLSFASTDLFGLGIPYNQFFLKMNIGKMGMLLGIGDLQNDIDLTYRERTGSLTTQFEISDKLTLGGKITLSQLDTVITGSGWGLDLGLIYRPISRLELSVGTNNLIARKQFSTNREEQGEININALVRYSFGGGFALLGTFADNDFTLGLEQQLSNKIVLNANIAHSRFEGGLSLLQNRTGFDYKLAVHSLGIQQSIMLSVAF